MIPVALRGRYHAILSACAPVMLALVALLSAGPATATEQIPDVIDYQGQARPLHTEPFGALLDEPAQWQTFRDAAGQSLGNCTANWRGYRAWWALRQDRLWLERMVYGACDDDRARAADLQAYFPGQLAPIPATWYSGTLVIPLGAPGANSHMGYSTDYPRYALVEIQAGAITATHEIDHSTLMQLHQAARSRAETGTEKSPDSSTTPPPKPH